MSEMDDALTEAVNELGPALGSLEDRVAKRREELEKHTTERFDVPGFEGVFQVELRLIGGKRKFQGFKAHEHVRDEYQQSVRVAADLVLAATVAFHSVLNEEGDTVVAEGASWKRFAKAFDKTLTPETLGVQGGGRLALIRLLGEEGTLTLAGEYQQWCRTRGVKVERELGDFS